MKTHALISALILAFSLVPGAALAGKKDTVQVSVSNTLMAGSLSNARSSNNSVERIGCTLLFSNNAESVLCSATSAQNVTKLCTSTTTKLVDAVRALNGDSHIQIDFNAAGTCTSIFVTNDSRYAPKLN